MRQGFWVGSLFLMAAIVGCGGSGAYKSASLANASSTVSSSATGSSSPGSGTSPSGSSAATPPSSGSSSNSGSNSAGTSTGSSSSSPAPSAGAEVAITSPGDGATVSSPTQVTTSVGGSVIINATQLYVDGAMAFQAASPQVSTALQISSGTHTIVAQVWDQNGNAYKSAAVRVTVQGSAPSSPPAPPSAPAPNAGEIQTLSGWDSCGSCAGHGGQGPDTPHSMQQGIGSPSLSGSSASFNASGSPWGDALWWRELGSHDDAQNMTYDLDFYIDDSVANAQALEFDVNQTVGGSKYIFGTECDFRGSGTFRVWNGPAATWATTGLSCPVPQPNTWHHLTWEFQRSGGQAHFVAVTLDGNRQSVGMAFDGTPLSGSGLDVAFQIDLMDSGAGVTVWLDNVNLSW